MKAIVVIDDDNGMMFNHRRQSQDSILREKIVVMSAGSRLLMNSYSQKQFSTLNNNMYISETFLDDANEGDYCFVENHSIAEYESKIEELIVFRWNRRYPGDFQLDFVPELHDMNCIKTEEFQGSSHDKITMGVWVKDV